MFLESRKLKHAMAIIPGLLIILTACGANEPEQPDTDLVNATLNFSSAVEINTDQELHASLMVSNPGDTPFPEVDEFDAEMTLWTSDGEPRAKMEANMIQSIAPAETIQLSSGYWKLDPGVYFLTWGAPEYDGNITVFSIEKDADRINLGHVVNFNTNPADYVVAADHTGSIQSFSIEEDGTLTIKGQTSVPDKKCIFPILFDKNGVVEGFPAGACVQAAEGQWQMTLPSDPAGQGVQIEEDISYQVILFSEQLTLPPSQPFAVYISPPPQE